MKDSMTMEHPSMTITVQKSPDENLYQLQFLNSDDGPNLGHKTPLPEKEINVSLTISEEILNQHYTLGHPGRGVMIRLSKSGRIPQFQPTDIKRVISSCESCCLAKAHTGTTLKKTKHLATSPLE